ncbi:MAG: hypothetical protein GEU90_09420 [Gemmatimonas sp.]|nr:hypothetical protein [Gemmatimonas sp.]
MVDPLFQEPAASHVVRLPVLGVTTTFVTDSPAVFDTILDVYGGWADLDARSGVVAPSGATVKIMVHDDPGTPDAEPAFGHRVVDPTLLRVAWNGGTGVADARRLESIAHLSADLVERKTEFVEGVLEPLTLFLLGALDREPLHAAAVVRGDSAILLAGPSGTGKSTLAYAAWRHGFSLLADEPVYVQLRPDFRVWGRRSRVHLVPDSTVHFPELRDHPPTRLPSGKSKVVVELRDRVRRYADHAGICLLRRRDETRPALERIAPERAVAELSTDLEPGFDLFAGTIRERLARIAQRGAWRLTLNSWPDQALPFLDQVATELESVP